MNFSNPLGIQWRTVNEIVHNDEPARVVSGSRIFPTDANDLWHALTDADRIQRWFAPVSGELKLGGRYQIKGNAGGEITQCSPPKSLKMTWEFANNVSWVHITLKPESEGTRLTLDHIMRKDPASEDHWKKYGPGATGVGWELGFLGLGMHLDTGETVDQEASHAWFATDDGKAFIRSAAESWGVAHIESGENESVAKEMAEQTARFYTGESE